jgi:hypothetical protein
LLAVRLARAHNVPIELLAAEPITRSTIDADVSTFLGQSICPSGVSILPVGSEVMAWELFKEPENRS